VIDKTQPATAQQIEQVGQNGGCGVSNSAGLYDKEHDQSEGRQWFSVGHFATSCNEGMNSNLKPASTSL
jgi:hypothetical protein